MSLDLDCANYEDDFLSPDDSRDSAESESESENVPEFLQLGHLPKSAASGAGTAAQTKGSKGKGDGTKSRYKHVPHCEKPPQVVEKRNARERKRVQTVNSAFVKLRKFIPYENRHKRLSKVKTLRKAIEYIDHLQGLLAEYDKGHSSATPPPCTTPILSAPTYPEHPNSIATPDQLLLPHQQLLAPDDHNMLYGQPLTTGAVTTEQSFYKTDAHFTQVNVWFYFTACMLGSQNVKAFGICGWRLSSVLLSKCNHFRT